MSAGQGGGGAARARDPRVGNAEIEAGRLQDARDQLIDRRHGGGQHGRHRAGQPRRDQNRQAQHVDLQGQIADQGGHECTDEIGGAGLLDGLVGDVGRGERGL